MLGDNRHEGVMWSGGVAITLSVHKYVQIIQQTEYGRAWQKGVVIEVNYFV